MRRREFITLFGGGATVAWPFAASCAQPGDPMRRIGALMLYAENDPIGQARAAVFQQELEKLGWTLGRNLMIDFHWGVGDEDWIRAAAALLLARGPDLILASSSATVRPIQQATQTIPVIFIGGAR
jgi:putative ABC transport system substrate-binding protein